MELSFPEKPPVAQLLENFPTFHGTWRFITVFARALHYPEPDESNPYQSILFL
jgi:hypothetical protein